jgi:hypothetical protein
MTSKAIRQLPAVLCSIPAYFRGKVGWHTTFRSQKSAFIVGASL